MTYMLTSLTLAILIPLLLAGSGHEQVGDSAIYRYPKGLCRFFLYIIPVYGAMLVYGYATMTPRGRDANSSMACTCMLGLLLGLLILAHFYFDRYRVEIDSRAVTVRTIFGRKAISLKSLAQIVVVTGRATDLFLFDEGDRIVAKFGGSLQDFESFLGYLELHTQSSQVLLYRSVTGQGWEQRVNDGCSLWEPSKGPPYFRATARRGGIILIAGCLLIAIAIILSIWLNHGGFDYLQRTGFVFACDGGALFYGAASGRESLQFLSGSSPALFEVM